MLAPPPIHYNPAQLIPRVRMTLDLDRKLVRNLALFHIGVITLANYAVQFTATIGGYHFTWGMFVFPLVILATDLTVRLSNQRNARIIVLCAFGPAIVISAWLADWRIGLASASAYLLGQLLDIAVFQRIRARSRAWWTAPLVSTLCANVIDTYVFFAAAFHRSADAFMAENWVEFASVDLAFKTVVSILLFLPAYGILLNRINARLARG
ncbi:MAG: queuosine precursor transporter [bacterium]